MRRVARKWWRMRKRGKCALSACVQTVRLRVSCTPPDRHFLSCLVRKRVRADLRTCQRCKTSPCITTPPRGPPSPRPYRAARHQDVKRTHTSTISQKRGRRVPAPGDVGQRRDRAPGDEQNRVLIRGVADADAGARARWALGPARASAPAAQLADRAPLRGAAPALCSSPTNERKCRRKGQAERVQAGWEGVARDVPAVQRVRCRGAAPAARVSAVSAAGLARRALNWPASERTALNKPPLNLLRAAVRHGRAAPARAVKRASPPSGEARRDDGGRRSPMRCLRRRRDALPRRGRGRGCGCVTRVSAMRVRRA